MAEPGAGPDEQIEQLLRVNNELAAEIRSLTAGRTHAPRGGQVTAARTVARLEAERDALETRLRETEVALEHTRADRDGLEQQNREMDAEITRLRAGFAGFLRRARGQLLNR
jgi:chromosome segregation ATPase